MPLAYEELRQAHVAALNRQLPEHLHRLRWMPEQIREEREGRLRELVRTAKERSPWHRERLAGIDPETLNDRDLQRLPVMTKTDVMENWDAIVTDRRLNLALAEEHLATLDKDAYLLDHFHTVTSSGSTGRRGVFVYDWDGWSTVMALAMRNPLAWEVAHPDPRLRVHASLAAERATAITSAAAQTFSNPALPIVRIPITNRLADIVARLNEVQPTTLGSYPSMLNLLASEARAGRLSIHPHRINSTGEPLLKEMREFIEAALGAPIFNGYGSTEGLMSHGCGLAGGSHLADDLTYLEPVDSAGRPVPPGARSDKVYFTNLYNLALPLVRYEITDQVTILEEPCPCGSAHRRVADVEGRLDEVFTYRNGTVVHPYVIRAPLGRQPTILEYQVRQTARGADIDVRTVGEARLDDLRREVVSALTKLGLEHPEVAIRPVEELERGATGKLKRFVPLLPAAPAVHP